jgi:hypothetical protein
MRTLRNIQHLRKTSQEIFQFTEAKALGRLLLVLFCGSGSKHYQALRPADEQTPTSG